MFQIKRIFDSFVFRPCRGAGACLRHLLQTDDRASTTVMVALSVPVFVGALGVGVDTGAWYMEKRRVQQIADSAALGGARVLADGQNVATAQTVANRDAARNGYISGNGASIVVNSPPTSGAYTGKSGAVEVIVTRKLPSLFSSYVLGSSARTIKGRAVAYSPPVQKKNLEVSLVLDVTGSMNGNTEVWGTTKLEAMQAAAKKLIDVVIQQNQSTYTSRVSLTPFSAAVNVGSDYFRTATNKTQSGSWSSVVERTGSYKFTDDPPSSTYRYFGDYKTLRSSALGPQGYYQAYQNSNVPANALITPLTSDKNVLTAAINAYTAGGSTAGHIGLAWAWYQLSPKWSSIFTGTAAPSAYDSTKTYKALVIMSDFDFNVYYQSANGSADTQFSSLCTNAKNAGVDIYVVGYYVSGSSDTALMNACASGASKIYTSSSVASLYGAFESIAAQTVIGASELTLKIVE